MPGRVCVTASDAMATAGKALETHTLVVAALMGWYERAR